MVTAGRTRFGPGSSPRSIEVRTRIDRPVALHLTYAELAARIGRSEPAAKSLAKRKRWRRSIGNDGLTRITIDEPELVELADPDRRSVGRPPANSSRASQSEPLPEPPSEPGSNPVQTAIAELQARLAVAEALAEERNGALTTERERAERLAAEVADLARHLARVVEDAAGREREMQGRLVSSDAAAAQARADLALMQKNTETDVAQARAELDAWRSRPWWRRIAG